MMNIFKGKNRDVWSWALYDFANSAFATTVMAGFFPMFYKEYWGQGKALTETTFTLGLGNSLASILIAVVAPILGAVSDAQSSRKRFLFILSWMGILSTAGLFFLSGGNWLGAIILYVLGVLGFSGANIFYDSLIILVAGNKNQSKESISAMGFSLGYLGGGVLFALNVLMVLYPSTFFIPSKAMAVKISFLMVALWWALFSIPLWLWVDETKIPKKAGGPAVLGLRQVRKTFKNIRQYRLTFLFLLAYWLYIDGVDTIIRMAIDYGLSIGLDSNGLITALLITQFVGFPSALLFGKFAGQIGSKNSILCGLGVYIGVTIWGYFMSHQWEFYALAIVIGLVQGGVQAISRSLFSELVPPQQEAEFFGFYNMMGKFAAVIGPLLMGVVTQLSGSHRFGILSLLVLFISGGVLLWSVDFDKAKSLVGRGKVGL